MELSSAYAFLYKLQLKKKFKKFNVSHIDIAQKALSVIKMCHLFPNKRKICKIAQKTHSKSVTLLKSLHTNVTSAIISPQ